MICYMQHTHHHTSIDCRKEDDIMPDVTVSHGGTKLSVASFTYGRVQFGGGRGTSAGAPFLRKHGSPPPRPPILATPKGSLG